MPLFRLTLVTLFARKAWVVVVLAAVALAFGAEALSIINNELVRAQSPREHAAAPPVVRLAHLAVDVHGLADLVPVEGRLVGVDELFHP